MDSGLAQVVEEVSISQLNTEGSRSDPGFDQLPSVQYAHDPAIPGTSTAQPVDPGQDLQQVLVQLASPSAQYGVDPGMENVPYQYMAEEDQLYEQDVQGQNIEPSGPAEGFQTIPPIAPRRPIRQALPTPRPPAQGLAAARLPAPVRPQASLTSSDLATLRSLLPNLGNMSDNLMRAMDINTLVELNKASQGGGGSASATPTQAAAAAAAAAAHFASSHHFNQQDPALKMAKNLETLRDNPIGVEEGFDDRIGILHPARFLGGAVCSAKKQWQAAREAIGLQGITPLATYDFSAVGLSGCATPQGLLELHNPSSSKLQVKQFSSVNMTTAASVSRKLMLADGDTAINVGDNLAEIVDLKTFEHAMRVLCTAARMIMPWNYAFEALHNFFHATQFGAKDLAGHKERVPTLVDFSNSVFKLNATAWIQKEDFLSVGDLKTTWSEFIANRPSALLTSPGDGFNQPLGQRGFNARGRGARGGRGGRGGFQVGGQQGSQQGGQQGVQMPNTTVPPPSQPYMIICRNHNRGLCTNPHTACFLPSGSRAYHVCDVITSQGVQCRGYHRRDQHR